METLTYIPAKQTIQAEMAYKRMQEAVERLKQEMGTKFYWQKKMQYNAKAKAMNEFNYESYGESETYLEAGWYTISELKELIVLFEQMDKRQKDATKQLLGIKNE